MKRLALVVLVLAGCNTGPVTPPAPTPIAAIMPWPAPPPSRLPALMKAAGLAPIPGTTSPLDYEALFSAHLDVFRDGIPVFVPPGLSLEDTGAFAAAMHTHALDGWIHVEALDKATYTIGQLFTLWDVPLVGATAFEDGRLVDVPGSIALRANKQITVVFGTPPMTIPAAPPATP